MNDCEYEHTKKSEWLRTLRGEAKRPLLEVIDSIEGSGVHALERRWINKYRETDDLLNTHERGARALTPRDRIAFRTLVVGGICKHGHPLTSDNVKIRPDRRNCVECKTCHANSRREFHTRRPLYDVWATMIRRTSDATFKDWRLYGGKAEPVTVCERWLNYDNFESDMSPRPTLLHSLERIDGMRGYERDNCKWATAKEQSRNVSSNRSIEHNGATHTLAEWAEMAGLKYMTLFERIRRGWEFSDAIARRPLTQAEAGKRSLALRPPPPPKVFVEWRGQRVPLAEVARREGVKYSILYGRIVESGWTVTSAITAPPLSPSAAARTGHLRRKALAAK